MEHINTPPPPIEVVELEETTMVGVFSSIRAVMFWRKDDPDPEKYPLVRLGMQKYIYNPLDHSLLMRTHSRRIHYLSMTMLHFAGR